MKKAGIFTLFLLLLGGSLFAMATQEQLDAAKEQEEKQPRLSLRGGTEDSDTTTEQDEDSGKDWNTRIGEDSSAVPRGKNQRDGVEDRILFKDSKPSAEKKTEEPVQMKLPSISLGKEKGAGPESEDTSEISDAEAEPDPDTGTAALSFKKNSAGLSAYFELYEEEVYVSLHYSRMFLPWLGANATVALGLFDFDFAFTLGVLFDAGFPRFMLNAGMDSYTGFIVQPMVGFEVGPVVIVLEVGITTDSRDFLEGLRPGLGVQFMF